nr:septation protein SepH [Gordonia humi]
MKAQHADPDGGVICVDVESGEEFSLTVDDTLREAISPTPSPPAPVEPGIMLSPREIQARVRAGATVDELAEVTGERSEKIYRFAHPVLLERTRAAELARASHPAGIDGPSDNTLGELVAECLALRGNSTAETIWDAWRPEDGRWVVQIGWGPQDQRDYAHWRFTPGSHGGTTEPLDDFAVELTEPELARASRRSTFSVVPHPPEPPQREVLPDGHEQVTVDADSITQRQSGALELEFDDDSDGGGQRGQESPQQGQGPRHRSGKRATPTVPAWEDVLLGVRSHPGE